jgi:hypothetical protein
MFIDENRTPILKRLAGAVSGIGASQTMVIKIPPGSTYADLTLKLFIGNTGATRAQIESMLTSWRLTMSGREIWTLTGKQLLAVIAYYRSGLVDDTGYVTIPFQRLWMDGLSPKIDPMYGTLGESSFQLEITEDATNTIDTVAIFARISPVSEELGAFVRMVRLTPSVGAAGVYQFPDLPKRKGDYLYALHIQVPTVADLTDISYLADEIRVWDHPVAVSNRYILEGNPTRTLQTAKGFVHVDFCSRNLDSDAVPLSMQTQMLELTFANAPSPTGINVIAEIGTRQPNQAGVVNNNSSSAAPAR